MTFGSASLTTTTPELPSSDKQLLGWNELGLGQTIDWDDTTINLADFLDDQTNPAAVHVPGPSVDHSLNIQQEFPSYNMSIPAVPTIYTLRSLVPRPAREPGQQRIANLVFHTLKSYPLMIMRHNTLPPFIHPCSMLFHDDNNNMETLANCLSLMHMLGSKIHGSRKLFWKNVRWECERMREQHTRMNKWELLAAMQALSVYLLVRLQEGETEHNNYDSLMLATVIIVAREFARTESGCDIESIISNTDTEASWKAWVFVESRRRLAVVYRVVDMLVYFEPASMCELQKDLIIAPLPAKKQLWEAGDKDVWEEVAKRDNGIHESFALTADGGLVHLDEGQLYCSQGALRYRIPRGSSPTPEMTDWEHWCSGMDGFGNLIMLAASLIV
ncbi:hypothetical protein D6D15_03002 [Aureobasidium pullulans]|uniref:Transcription factor domain-containing protein n=1 Tax=Aureobasidium pullulans TaxID=5580 RepID=A0A4S9BGZ5_AURPU|nr:hypothetical protein D6D15_03002 [Aureobasidium pullulans]